MHIISRDFALAVKAVIVKGDKVLLLKRSKQEMESSYMNKHEEWDLPGGGVRFFETSEKALLREIAEETKLSARIKKPIGLYDAMKSQLHLAIFTYACEYLDGEVKLSREHSAYYWMTIEEMEKQKVPKWLIRDSIEAVELLKYVKEKREGI